MIWSHVSARWPSGQAVERAGGSLSAGTRGSLRSRAPGSGGTRRGRQSRDNGIELTTSSIASCADTARIRSRSAAAGMDKRGVGAGYITHADDLPFPLNVSSAMLRPLIARSPNARRHSPARSLRARPPRPPRPPRPAVADQYVSGRVEREGRSLSPSRRGRRARGQPILQARRQFTPSGGPSLGLLDNRAHEEASGWRYAARGRGCMNARAARAWHTHVDDFDRVFAMRGSSLRARTSVVFAAARRRDLLECMIGED
jgi:hypothetical protein